MAKEKFAEKENQIFKASDKLPMKPEDSKFKLVRTPPEKIRDIVSVNLGGKKLSAFDLDRIRIPDGKSDFWTVPTLEGSKAVEEIQGVVINWRNMRAWWPSADPTGEPPSCSSSDNTYGWGDRKSDTHYQEDKAEERHLCEECWYAQFKSDPKSGRGQWCKQTKAIFIVFEDALLPSVIFVPPTSIKVIESFFSRLVNAELAYYQVCVGLGLDKKSNVDGQQYNVVKTRLVHALQPIEQERFAALRNVLAPDMEKVKVESSADVY